jgi:PAS domain-containing protein
VLRPSERDTAPAGLSARPDPPSDPDDVALARFMADAGRILGASLDIEDTLREVAQLAVPTIADWCAIDLLGADGTLRSVAIAHQDPARVALVEALAREYPADPASPTGPHEAVRQRRSISGEVTPEMLAAVAQDERHARLIAELDLHAWMIVPMLLGERVLGTIAFVAAESGRTFGPRHVAFAEHLALRAGVAIDNARSFHTADRFRRILDTVAEAVFVLDGVSGEVRDVNKGALDLLASPPDRLVGRPWMTRWRSGPSIFGCGPWSAQQSRSRSSSSAWTCPGSPGPSWPSPGTSVSGSRPRVASTDWPRRSMRGPLN